MKLEMILPMVVDRYLKKKKKKMQVLNNNLEVDKYQINLKVNLLIIIMKREVAKLHNNLSQIFCKIMIKFKKVVDKFKHNNKSNNKVVDKLLNKITMIKMIIKN